MTTAQPVLVRGKYRLDFEGKMKIPSSKNFILKQGDHQALLFGKINKDTYFVEVSYPLSLFEAFGVCLTSLDSKLLVSWFFIITCFLTFQLSSSSETVFSSEYVSNFISDIIYWCCTTTFPLKLMLSNRPSPDFTDRLSLLSPTSVQNVWCRLGADWHQSKWYNYRYILHSL